MTAKLTRIIKIKGSSELMDIKARIEPKRNFGDLLEGKKDWI